MMVLLKSMIIGAYSFLPRSGFVQQAFVQKLLRIVVVVAVVVVALSFYNECQWEE